MKTLIIFDVDGTLVYSNRVDSRCFALTYEQLYGKPFPSIDWTKYPHVTDTNIFATAIRQHFDRAVTVAETEAFQQAFVDLLEQRRREAPEEFHLVPGARDTVYRLLEDPHYELGIATGGWERPAQIKLEHVGLPWPSMLLHGADGRQRREEILQAVQQAADRQYSNIERIVYIGDAIWDVTTTRNLNMPFVGIRRGGDREILLRAGATEVIADYRDFEGFLRSVREALPPRNGK